MTAPGRIRRRRTELRQRRKRRGKVKKLKKAYQAAKTDVQRTQIITKLLKLSPSYPVQEFQAVAK